MHNAHAATAPATGVRTRSQRLAAARELIAWTLVSAALGWFVWQRARPVAVTDAPVIRAQLDLPANSRIHESLTGATLALTPQGDRVVFTAISVDGFRLYARSFSELAAWQLADQNVAARNLAISPDGRWVAFTEGSAVRKTPIDGGAVTTVSSFATVPYGLTWLSNDTIVIGSFTGLHLIDASGGNLVMVPRSDTTADRIGQRWPVVVPGTDVVVYTSGASNVGDGRLAVSNVRTGELKVFDIPLAVPLGLQHGQLVYVTGAGLLMAVPFDVRALEPRGEAVQIDDHVMADAMAGAKASLSASGTLAFLRGRTEIQPVLVNQGTNERQFLLAERQQYLTPRYSPAGTRVAISVVGPNSVLADGPTTQSLPRISPDGKWLAYQSNEQARFEIFVRPFPGSGARMQVSTEGGTEPIWDPSGRTLYYRGQSGQVIAVSVTTGDRFSIGTRKTIVTGDYLLDTSHASYDIGPDGRILLLARVGAETQAVIVHNWARELRAKTAPRR